MESISNSLDLKEIGTRIRAGRENFELTREEIAEIVGLSPFFIGQIERGERRMSLDTLYKISDSLNLSLDFILKGHDFYMENFIVEETVAIVYKSQINKEIQELILLLSGASIENIMVIKEMTKLILPYLNK